jgi:hypothetical protein
MRLGTENEAFEEDDMRTEVHRKWLHAVHDTRYVVVRKQNIVAKTVNAPLAQ